MKILHNKSMNMYLDMFENNLTKELDMYLKDKVDSFNIYIYNTKILDTYPIRYPGLTIGGITVDENNIITNIKMNNDIFKQDIADILNKYMGDKFVI